ncbi:polynucleotide 2',3'-cyclic phosphate phosphodiesterase / polynucleotide 3'-phosphatase / polynucleotide 5'-hydroxyl-kinase [Candidatus Koribacter versatilis Ellin345]|uniref:Polynucleotide 2',3'-cyclic phosphate phosphodiesterase / polynucleotide 3'-phosphatase / polynucleotide 5'-hydroxyl-kinase n=1 Tax=Koribacter versatilis (strain Ellin345) TaxID=204669 RepID=Q1IQ72_KORVE|nr:polynucleotide kinase-phosphatase [Candidatus Koribacter versatilis]ABF40978.1 polynucleotide 2',3'-cyclic phosphate phosphodiesterase / polynucleotide 3'-phosphatase / polynucleotide 5'-hydroxyl-kinase [Candidatus Koribacter versatilis Ellin345]
MNFKLPEMSLVLLIGPSGCGKSTFARKHFKPTEVISSDFCRGLVSDDENDQSATKEAFDLLHYILRKRLAAGRLTVVDATNVQPESRKPLIEIAKEYHLFTAAIAFNFDEKICQDRNRNRPDRQFGAHVVRNQAQQMRRGLRGLEREGIRYLTILSSSDDADNLTIERQPLWTNKKHEHGPFDVIGDIHGCADELEDLLAQLGYRIERENGDYRITPPEGRRAIFLGDLVDRGPRIPDVLKIVMSMVNAGTAFCVPGNHDTKLLRWLGGKDVKIAHGLADTIQQFEAEPPEFKKTVAKFLDSLIGHYVLDGGKLVVAHAGMKESMQGRSSGAVRSFALFGETTGETDEFGLPVRFDWASEYRGSAMVVYGHTPVPQPQWLNNTINIDTGCVFGGGLTALRYPEKELVSVPARKTYYASPKPFLPKEDAPTLSQQHQLDDVLDIEDVIGKRVIATRLHGNITIREENAIAALEVMSRFATNPKWLIYLPPTMSPSETTKQPNLLEHPAEAFEYFRREGVAKVVCEQKHMGSRAVVIVCRDRDAAVRRFGITQDEIGVCYTRTGRRFFNDDRLERDFLARVQCAVEKARLWTELKTDWVCLDCELMPWSSKAQELLVRQYAPTGAAGRAALRETVAALRTASNRVAEIEPLIAEYDQRLTMVGQYVDAYRRYCWPVHSLLDLKLAPFHLLAAEGQVFTNRDHVWHMETLARLCAQDHELLLATPYRVIDLAERASEEEGIAWWEELTAAGGEGMVVKPVEFIARGKHLVQPAVKCRGREYLRIIYGPEYTAPEHLERLRSRGLGRKRSLALREFSLGVEALQRFAEHEPLRRVHECVFGVLALESEPVDPRL